MAPFLELDPDTLSEAELRAWFPKLLSLAEACASAVRATAAELLHLQREVARLKVEHGPPSRPAPRDPPAPASPSGTPSASQEAWQAWDTFPGLADTVRKHGVRY
jgi:hypothetical protein